MLNLSSKHTLDSVARDGVYEEKEEDGQEEDGNQFDDSPLVVMPNNVAD